MIAVQQCLIWLLSNWTGEKSVCKFGKLAGLFRQDSKFWMFPYTVQRRIRLNVLFKLITLAFTWQTLCCKSGITVAKYLQKINCKVCCDSHLSFPGISILPSRFPSTFPQCLSPSHFPSPLPVPFLVPFLVPPPVSSTMSAQGISSACSVSASGGPMSSPCC